MLAKMKFSRLSDAVLNRNSVWAVLLVLIIFLYSGCGGNDGGQVLPNVTGSEKVTSFEDLTKVTVKDMALTNKNADEYYDRLEKILNGEYSSLSNAPRKAAGTPYLTNMTLSIRTDEVQALGNYNLVDPLKITATANYSDGTTEIVMPAWMVYSGSNSLVNNIYTAPAAAGQTVFIAYFSKDGVTRFAIFRLTVNSMSLLDLSMDADAVQASGNYDLSSITVYAKSSNGTSEDVTGDLQNTKWSLLSGRGTLNGNVYTAPAMADTAIFLVRHTKAGVVASAQFTLKINGLTSISLNKTTDEIQLPATYDLDSELIVTAKYSSGSTLEVTHLAGLTWALTSGSGTLAGTVYTPTAKVETAVFTGSYTESGITKTTTFQLKTIGLSSLSLNKTTDEVQSCANYSLADNLILTDKLSNGTTTNRTMDPNTKWTLVSGRGTLNGMVYTAPALAETAVIAATYTEAGISKTINFRLRVNALISLTLSKTTDETVISAPYDIASKLAVFAKFSSGQTKEVTTNPNLRWTISFGSGILNGAVYTTPERIETAVIVATYTENGVAQSARFSLKVSATAPGTKVLLVGLTINKSTDAVQINGTYDLRSLAAIGKYLDKTTREVTLSWIVTSGGGSVSGNIYTAPANAETVRVMGSCTAEDGSVKSVYFTLSVYGTEIYGTRGVVTTAGAKFHLNNGLIFEIPPNSVGATTEVAFTFPESYGIIDKTPGQTFLTCTSTNKIYNATLQVPIIKGMSQNDITLTCIMPDLNKIIRSTPIIDDTISVFIISSNITNSSPLKSPNYDATGDPIVYSNTTFIIYKNDPIAQESLMNIINNKNSNLSKPVYSFRWPHYRQYWQTCFAATTLMLMKGYKTLRNNHELDPQFDSIYKIINKMITYNLIVDFDKEAGADTASPENPENGINWITHWFTRIDNIDFRSYMGQASVPDLIRTYNQFPVRAYTCENLDALINLVPIKISQNKPLKVDSVGHSILICGYEMNKNSYSEDEKTGRYKYEHFEIYFWINNPTSTSQPYERVSAINFNKMMRYGNENLPFVCYSIDLPFNVNNARVLQTIHLSDEIVPINSKLLKPEPGGIDFIDENKNRICYTSWNPESSDFTSNSIEWKPGNPIGNPALFYNIQLKSIPIFNADNQAKTVFVKASIYDQNSTNLLVSEPCIKGTNSHNSTPFANENFEILGSSVNTDNFYQNTELVKKFISKLKSREINGGKFVLLIELIDFETKITLDKFDVKFECCPLIISTTKKIEFLGNPILFEAVLGSGIVTNQVTWKVETPDNNVETDGEGIFVNGLLKTKGEITAPKEYTITATYTDGTGLIKTSEPIKIKVLPGIIPLKKVMLPGQSFQFTFGTPINGILEWLKWNINDTITQNGLYTANTQEGLHVIQVTLNKGTVLSSGEILETDLVSKSNIYVHDYYIQSDKTIIDISKTCSLELRYRLTAGNIADKAEWSADSGSFEKSGADLYFKPSKPGPVVIKAKLKESAFLNSGYPLESDLEVTTKITVVKISYSPDNLSARSTPIDAIGNPMEGVNYPNANYGTTANLTVNVDGADVPINLAIAEGSGKGTLSLVSKTGDKDQLPVTYNFNFKPAISTKIYYGSDDKVKLNITCPDSVDSSTSAACLIYRPIQGTVERDFYYDTAHGEFQVVKYSSMSTEEFIYKHGYYRVWYIPNPSQTCEEANYFCGQGLLNNYSTHYYQNGRLIEMCIFGSTFLEFEFKFYTYESSGDLPITQISVFKYTRPNFYSPWSSIQLPTTTVNGYVTPPAALQPVPVSDQPIIATVPLASPRQK